MKRLLLFCALFFSVTASAQEIHSVSIKAVIAADGSARITQVWDATVFTGTEWYIPVENLGKMKISNLSVSENGVEYASDGDHWKTGRTAEQKTGRCGIVKKSDGVELCWGQGSMGRHVWMASFDAANLVQGYNDYDGFNFMFVNPGIGAINAASVVIENATGGAAWTSDNVKVWAFGFEGEINVTDGKIVCTSSGSMSRSHKMIILARFDKGLVNPVVSHDKSFEKLQKKAFKGSDYKEKGEGYGKFVIILAIIAFVLSVFALIYVLVASIFGFTESKGIYGTTKVTGWWHEPPQEGNLFAAYYILEKGERFPTGKWEHGMDLIGACFLKWVMERKAIPQRDEKHPNRYNLKLNPAALFDNKEEADLFEMVLQASGDNVILEKGEFERWSKRKYDTIMEWPEKAANNGKDYLISKGRLDAKGKSTLEGQEEACHVIQFKNYLKDFTLNKEREVPEVDLWKDYLVFAQLYGIADAVTKQFQKLYPADFERLARSLDMEPGYFYTMVHMNRALAYNAYSGAVSKATSVRSSGGGGFSSLGGGGGFSGGGFGGGSR